MVRENYLIRIPVPDPNDYNESDTVPKLQVKPHELFLPPDINLLYLKQLEAGIAQPHQDSNADIYWHLNFKRFHQEFRDNLMISAIERKLDANAAECFKYILKLIYERTDPWQRQSSNPFTLGELKQIIERDSTNSYMLRYLDQYLALIDDDTLGFIRKTGDMGGGQYAVVMDQAFEELSLACIENVITERFGSKASRIFRVIRNKQYIEQEDLQKEAMIPAKEAKLLSYNLFQEQFIQIKTIRKTGGGGVGPARAFYLFHVKQKQIVKMLLNMCFKSLYNNISRADFEKTENKHIIEKSQKLDSIVATMKERGASEEYIAEILETLTPPEREILDKVKRRIETLSKAELTMDDTIFLLQMYLYHTAPMPAITKK